MSKLLNATKSVSDGWGCINKNNEAGKQFFANFPVEVSPIILILFF